MTDVIVPFSYFYYGDDDNNDPTISTLHDNVHLNCFFWNTPTVIFQKETLLLSLKYWSNAVLFIGYFPDNAFSF